MQTQSIINLSNFKRPAPTSSGPITKRVRYTNNPVKKLKTQLHSTRQLIHKSTFNCAQTSIVTLATLWTSLQPNFDEIDITFKQSEDLFKDGMGLINDLHIKEYLIQNELILLTRYFFNKMIQYSSQLSAHEKSKIVHNYFLLPFEQDAFKEPVIKLAKTLNETNELSPFPTNLIDSILLFSRNEIELFLQCYSATFEHMSSCQKLINKISFSLLNLCLYSATPKDAQLNKDKILRTFRSFKNVPEIKVFLTQYFNEFYHKLLCNDQLHPQTKLKLTEGLLLISGKYYSNCISGLLHTRHADASTSIAILESQKQLIFSENLFSSSQLLLTLLKIKHKRIREWVILTLQRRSTPLPIKRCDLELKQTQLKRLEAHINQCLGMRKDHPADLMRRMLTGHYDTGVREDTWGFKTDATDEKTAQAKAKELITMMFREFKITPKLTPTLIEGGAGLGLFMTTFFEQLESHKIIDQGNDQELFDLFKNKLTYVIVEQSKELSDRWKTDDEIYKNKYLNDNQKKILIRKHKNKQLHVFNASFLNNKFIVNLTQTFPTSSHLIFHYSNEIVDVLAHHYISKDTDGNLQLFSMEGPVQFKLDENLAQLFTYFFPEEINHLISLEPNQYIPFSIETLYYYINVAMLNPIHVSIDDYYQLEYLKDCNESSLPNKLSMAQLIATKPVSLRTYCAKDSTELQNQPGYKSTALFLTEKILKQHCKFILEHPSKDVTLCPKPPLRYFNTGNYKYSPAQTTIDNNGQVEFTQISDSFTHYDPDAFHLRRLIELYHNFVDVETLFQTNATLPESFINKVFQASLRHIPQKELLIYKTFEGHTLMLTLKAQLISFYKKKSTMLFSKFNVLFHLFDEFCSTQEQVDKYKAFIQRTFQPEKAQYFQRMCDFIFNIPDILKLHLTQGVNDINIIDDEEFSKLVLAQKEFHNLFSDYFLDASQKLYVWSNQTSTDLNEYFKKQTALLAILQSSDNEYLNDIKLLTELNKKTVKELISGKLQLKTKNQLLSNYKIANITITHILKHGLINALTPKQFCTFYFQLTKSYTSKTFFELCLYLAFYTLHSMMNLDKKNRIHYATTIVEGAFNRNFSYSDVASSLKKFQSLTFLNIVYPIAMKKFKTEEANQGILKACLLRDIHILSSNAISLADDVQPNNDIIQQQMLRINMIIKCTQNFPDLKIDIYRVITQNLNSHFQHHMNNHHLNDFNDILLYFYSSLTLKIANLELESKESEFDEISNKLRTIFNDPFILNGLKRSFREPYDVFKKTRSFLDYLINFTLKKCLKRTAPILKRNKLTPKYENELKTKLETIGECLATIKHIKSSLNTPNLISHKGLNNIKMIETLSIQINNYLLFNDAAKKILKRTPSQNIDLYLDRLVHALTYPKLNNSNKLLLDKIYNKLRDLKAHCQQKFPNEDKKSFLKEDKIILNDCLFLVKLHKNINRIRSPLLKMMQREYLNKQFPELVKKFTNNSRLSNAFRYITTYYLNDLLLNYTVKMLNRIEQAPTYGPIIEESGRLVDQFSNDYKELSNEIELYTHAVQTLQRIPNHKIDPTPFEKMKNNIVNLKIRIIKQITQHIHSKKQLAEVAMRLYPIQLCNTVIFPNSIGPIINGYINEKTCLENYLFSESDKKLFHRFLGIST
ncbi:MAG: hypothetical protein ACON35_00220 [Candidatus Marinamargulisbacteria bacterium]